MIKTHIENNNFFLSLTDCYELEIHSIQRTYLFFLFFKHKNLAKINDKSFLYCNIYFKQYSLTLVTLHCARLQNLIKIKLY